MMTVLRMEVRAAEIQHHPMLSELAAKYEQQEDRHRLVLANEREERRHAANVHAAALAAASVAAEAREVRFAPRCRIKRRRRRRRRVRRRRWRRWR